MFHFADYAPDRVLGFHQVGCPIRRFTDRRLLASPRNVSPLAASFIAVRCHGHSPYALHLLVLSLHRCLVFTCQSAQGNLLSLLCCLVEMIGFEPTTYGLQSHRSPTEPHPHMLIMVGRGGFEPPTSRLSAACSNQLSYRPIDRITARKSFPT